MSSRSYNPSPFPISNSIEDTLEYYNNRKNPNSQPMIFKYPERVVIRDTPRQDIGRLYGGNMKMLEMDEKEPQRRPAGYVEPHSSGAKKYISNGNSASYPVFNSVEQKAIDTKRGGLMLLKDPEGWNKKTPDVVLNDKQRKALNAFGDVFHPKDPNLVMVGNGLWQDMNAWGKQNEVNFNKFGKDVENTTKGILNNPQVQAIMNDPAVQKMGKSAIKTAVSYIPVVGAPASQVLGLMGWGGVPRAVIVKKIMAEKNMSLTEASHYVKANNLYTPKPKKR
jgi:hypothetical protein